MFFMINGMHGLISHFNVDVRLGWFSHVFAGTETYPSHHSAVMSEAKNDSATPLIDDLLFGTFVYRAGVAPAELGTAAASRLPPHAPRAVWRGHGFAVSRMSAACSA